MRHQVTDVIRRCLETVLIVLIILKLLHLIDWSWWWVLSLLWMPVLLAIVAYLVDLALRIILALRTGEHP